MCTLFHSRRTFVNSIFIAIIVSAAAILCLSRTLFEDKLVIAPNPLTFADDKPQKLTIKNPAGISLEGSSRFRVTSPGFTNNANNLIKFDPDTLMVTPLTSGQMVLKIEYKENDTATPTQGEVKVVIPYKTVYLTEPFKKTPDGDRFKNDAVSLLSGQKYDLKAEGVDVKGKTVSVTAEVSVSNNFVSLDAVTTPTMLKAQSINASAESVLKVKVDETTFQEIPVRVAEAITKIEVVVGGAPQTNVASISIPEGRL